MACPAGLFCGCRQSRSHRHHHYTPSLAELKLAFNSLGRQRLFNTSGQSYRALGSAAVKAMDDAQALQALAADGKLIKRPFVITGAGAALVGFKQEEWQTALGA